MEPLTVFIVGSGKAAAKHEHAFSMLNRKFRVTNNYEVADIVSICSTHDKHFDDALVAIYCGKHVICEKPLAGSMHDVDEIIKEADLHDVSVYPVFQYRYAEHSSFEDILMLSFRRDRKYWTGWRADWDRSFGGAVTMHGIHALDLVAAAVGMPSALKCQLSGPPELAVETRAMITMQWDSGAQFQIAIAADWELGDGEIVNPWSTEASPAAYLKLFDSIYEDVADSRGRKPLKGMFGVRVVEEEDERLPTLADARNAVELLTMCYKSHIYGMYVQRVDVNDTFYHGWTDLAKKWYGTPEPSKFFLG